MEKKVYVNVENIAVFECPKCGTTRTANMTDKKHLGGSIKTKCTCNKCEHTFVVTVVMEMRRKFYRKETNLAGEYYTPDNRIKGVMRVCDVSLTGVRMNVNDKKDLKVGQKLVLEFILDDKLRSEIKRNVIIRKIENMFINCEFEVVDQYGRLASYLFG
jgi:hypothetical protein